MRSNRQPLSDRVGSLPVLPRTVRVGSLVAVVAVIVYFSLLDTPVPATGPPTPLWDKQLHFASYAALTLTASQATLEYRDRGRLRIVAVVGFAIAFGIGIELAQWPLANRFAAIDDVLANTIGSLIASIVFAVESRLGYADEPAPRDT